MKINETEMATIRDDARDLLLAIGKIDIALLAQEDWAGATNVAMFSLGEIAGLNNRIRDSLSRIMAGLGEASVLAPGVLGSGHGTER